MRLEDWPSRLHDVIEAAREKPFAWGSHDCCTFAADCAEAVTGRRLWPEVGNYRTKAGALRVMRAAKFFDLGDGLDLLLGPRKPPSRAQRGDVVLVRTGLMPSCAVVDLTGEWVVGPAPGGLDRVHLVEAFAAWTVD